MSDFWFGVLMIAAVWLFFSFRKNSRATAAHFAFDEITPWLVQCGLIPSSAKFSSYNSPNIVRNFGATALVGVARNDIGDTVGFAVEIIPGKGVVESEILVPSGIATWHRTASVEAQSIGIPLLDVLAAKSHSGHTKTTDTTNCRPVLSAGEKKLAEQPTVSAPVKNPIVSGIIQQEKSNKNGRITVAQSQIAKENILRGK